MKRFGRVAKLKSTLRPLDSLNPYQTQRKAHASTISAEEARVKFLAGKASGKELLGKTFIAAIQNQRIRQLATEDARFATKNHQEFVRELFTFFGTKKAKKPFSYAIIDLDHLKEMNQINYAFGDEAIGLVVDAANHIAKNTKGITARFGGDEILLFAPISGKKLFETIEKYRAQLNKQGHTFSAGVAELPKALKNPKETFDMIHHQANEAIKNSKKHGRNRTTLHK